VSLILTPPLPEEKGTKQNSTKKQKKEAEKSHKKKKIRFRLRIVFGVQYDDSMRNSVEGNTGWIANARLFPSRCNNKVVHLPDQDGVTNNHGTPGYNNSLASDLHHLTTTQILHSASSSALKTFTEAWTLLKIWCLQRGFLRGHDTFSEKSVGLSLAYLYRTRLVSIRMDSVQVFNVWMKFISDKDWTGAGQVGKKKIQSDINKNNIRHSSSLAYQEIELTLKPGKMARAAVVMPESEMTEQQTILNCIQNRLHASDLKHQENDENSMDVPKTLLESFKLNTDSPIFLDPTMTVNYFGNMSPSFMSEVQSEASKALNCIHYHGDGCGSRVDTFRQLFLEQQRFWTRYDSYLTLNIDDIAFPDKASSNNGKGLHFWGENIQDLGNYEAISRGLSKVLKMALGDRIDCVRTLTTGNGIVTEHLIPNNGDIGTTPIINGDEIPCTPIRNSTESSFTGFDLCSINSPIADGARKAKTITIGLRINPETCHRVVDRGPPADDADLSSVFVSLWGAQKAQLRRFKDGAIIHAVVWNDVESEIAQGRIQYEGSIKTGDIVERITRHIYRKHFCKNDIEEPPCPQFALNNMMSLVEIAQKEEDNGQSKSSEQMHKQIMSAFDSLATFLRNNSVIGKTPSGESVSKLGLPLRIDAVEAISPSLRYSELFPPSPHPFLGGDKSSNKKVAGVIVNDPIVIQIRFQGSAKWPQDINAMGAAKCAMLMQLAEGIEVVRNKGGTNSSSFDGPINVMPTYLDLGYQGYNFRIIVRADEELKMLQSLRSPSQEAIAIKQVSSYWKN
jgi:U3 small nucleolar RNA-associated protein 22